MMGDLNVGLNEEEKLVERGSVHGITNELSDFLEHVDLSDLKYYGLKYTGLITTLGAN